jgi:hypothetical protein
LGQHSAEIGALKRFVWRSLSMAEDTHV